MDSKRTGEMTGWGNSKVPLNQQFHIPNHHICLSLHGMFGAFPEKELSGQTTGEEWIDG